MIQSSTSHPSHQLPNDVVPPAITLRGVRKSFPVYRSKHDQLKALLFGHRWRKREVFTAIDGLDLDIRPGETLGLLGINGAGKSTLLHLIAQTLTPTAGTVAVNGRVAAILELGAGFNAAWTGRENADFHCRLNDVPGSEIDAQVERIAAFADIGAFFDQPMKNYSSGMYMRVAFAAAIMVDPDILIVDEALAVGDARFQQKCFARFRSLQQAGKTILFVTHATDLVPQYCTRAVILHGGKILFDGAPREAVERYTELLFKGTTDKELDPTPELVKTDMPASSIEAVDWSDQLRPLPKGKDGLPLRPYYNENEHRHGNGLAQIVDVAIRGEGGPKSGGFFSGERITLGLQIAVVADLPPLSVGMFLLTTGGVRLFGTATEMNGSSPVPVAAGLQAVVSIAFDIPLFSGSYFIDLSVFHDRSGEYVVHDVRHAVIELQVSSEFSFNGFVDLRAKIDTGQFLKIA